MFFIFYSFVYVNVSLDSCEILVKNFENGFGVIVNNKLLSDKLGEISSDTIYYGFELTQDDYENQEIHSFLQLLEQNMCGELILNEQTKLPIQFPPTLKIESLTYFDEILTPYQNNDSVSLSILNDLGVNILYNVLELSIYYSTNTNPVLMKMHNAFSQYLYPIIDSNLQKLEGFDILFRYNYPKLLRINLVLGMVDSYDLEKISLILEDNNLSDKVILYTTEDVFQSLPCRFYEKFHKVKIWNCSHEENLNVEYIYLDEDIRKLVDMEDNSKVSETYPLYVGSNKEECIKYLSYDKNDILENNISEDEMLINKYINPNFYGELSILPDGMVYSRKKTLPLGNIYKDDVKKMVLLEICKYRNWFMTRDKLNQCRNCVLNVLCPPITQLEIEMQYMTFCLK